MTVDTQALRDLAWKVGDPDVADALTDAAGTIDALRAVRDMEDFDAGWLAAESRFKRERDEARAEVARLREANAVLLDDVPVLKAEHLKLTTEVARLREALTAIAGRDQVENCLDPQWAARAARAALGEGTDG